MVSRRASSVQYSAIREIFDMAPQGAINMGIGEPDFGPPSPLLEGMREAMGLGLDGYGPTKGLPELRGAIAEMLKPHNSSITAENVMITCGATQGVMTAYQTLFDPAGEVLVPDPGFVLYSPDALLVDAEPVPYYLWEEDGFEPSVEMLKGLINPRTDGIVVNSPGNPTGGTLSKGTVKAIADLAQDKGFFIISDEVYDRFVYEGEHHSFLPYLENSIVVNSFSKCLGIPGWRIGYMVAEKAIIDQLAKINYYAVACPSTPVQYAVSRALEGMDSFMAHHRKEYDSRRRLMTSLLNEIPGFHCALPKGAFYAFPSYDQDASCLELAHALVNSGLICIPGCAFGDAGDGHLRFSYATSPENIRVGLEKVKEVVEGMPRLPSSVCALRKGRPC
ncbi:MAG: aminotransferase class I/II-fold pyridoxal phosphate-dependent enzyme [Methanomassiliicoccales archaeon]|nr:aminotransferase class I/II-fold pyridoxal phosphate-dependent enzyme [Methanomassiliicoccales archaeon]MDD1755516.1 aminotransferase class I/II-fold pyridoxal phosphate-dependent enzyme [Methanomassiliicoccales archaeon]